MTSKRNLLSTFKRIVILGAVLGLGISALPGAAIAAISPLNLGTASSYALLANAAITSATSSGVTGTAGGDVGVGGATPPTGNLNFSGASVLGGASIAALTSASSALADNRGGVTTGVELGGGRIITPGAYNNPTMDISGVLTLDALGDSDAVFIFRTASTLVTGISSSVLLVNGAQACNVYWQVGSSATLGTSSTIVGHVIALASISTGVGTQVNGQLIATTAAITLGGTTIVNNLCAAPVVAVVVPTPVVAAEPVVTPVPVVTPTPVVTTEPVVTPVPVVTAEPVVTPTPEVTAAATPTPVITPIPVVTESPVIVPVTEETSEPVTTTGGKLPVTATPWGNLLLLGCGLVILGGFGLISKSTNFNK